MAPLVSWTGELLKMEVCCSSSSLHLGLPVRLLIDTVTKKKITIYILSGQCHDIWYIVFWYIWKLYHLCDRFDPDFICNASDKRGRYSYQAQPSVCRWNLARLAEALGSELDGAEAGAILDEFMLTYEAFYLSIMRKKLGLVRKEETEDSELISDLLHVMHNTGTTTQKRWG